MGCHFLLQEGGWVFNLYFRNRHLLSVLLDRQRIPALASGSTVQGTRVRLTPVLCLFLGKQGSTESPRLLWDVEWTCPGGILRLPETPPTLGLIVLTAQSPEGALTPF